MSELTNSFTQLGEQFQFVLFGAMIVFGVGALMHTVGQIRKFASHRQDLAFKREMLDRGLSVEEIERLLKSQSPEKNCGR